MKRLNTAFFMFCLALISFTSVSAQETPHPNAPTATTDDDEPVIMDPPDETLPIDNHIVFLVASAVVLGGVVIYRNKIKKASI
ncbi:hypothetical protein DBR27_09835 [Flavobacterium sp. HMWF030]|nr:hypothetical protein DBR27_09835 [Flavobacterium sp. HMWF030]